MRPTKLICCEGVPGSGKSTTAYLLHRHLTRLDTPHRWWYEGERGHPLYTFQDSATLDATLADLFSGDSRRVQGVVDASLDRWRALASSLAHSDEIGLMDGILYGHLVWTLLAADVSQEVIEAYVAEAERLLQPLHPSLLYFRPSDVAASMQRLGDRRGERWAENFIRRTEAFTYAKRRGLRGVSGLVRYWEDYRTFADALFQRSALPKLRLDVDSQVDAGAWDANIRRVCAFLDLPPPPPGNGPPPDPALERFAGIYRFTHREQEGRCTVAYRRGALFLTGVPDIWRQTRLVPLGGDRFAAESLPFTFSFALDAAGRVDEMRADGPDFVWGSIPRRYARLPDAD